YRLQVRVVEHILEADVGLDAIALRRGAGRVRVRGADAAEPDFGDEDQRRQQDQPGVATDADHSDAHRLEVRRQASNAHGTGLQVFRYSRIQVFGLKPPQRSR